MNLSTLEKNLSHSRDKGATTMKTKMTTLVIACIAALCVSVEQSASAALTGGQSIGIDFDDGGNTAGSGSEANFLILTGAVTNAATTDTTGGSTSGVTVSFAAGGSSGLMGESHLGSQWQSGGPATGATGVYAGDASVFSDASFNDGYFTNDVLTVTFENLNPSLQYTLLGLGSGGFENTVTYNINGGGPIGSPAPLTYTQYTNYDNVSTANVTPYKLTGLTADGSGDLQVVLDGSSFFGFAALHLTAISEIDMEVVAWDFEDSNLGDTTQSNFFTIQSGDAFDQVSDGTESQPVPYDLLDGNTATVDAINPNGDDYLIRTDFAVNAAKDTVTKPGDVPQGVIESAAFLLPSGADLLALVLSADMSGDGGMLELVEFGGGVLATLDPALQSITLANIDVDILAHAGKNVFLRITDDSSGPWGHVAVDNILIQKTISLVAIPTPAALPAGLAMLALAAMRRRRNK